MAVVFPHRHSCQGKQQCVRASAPFCPFADVHLQSHGLLRVWTSHVALSLGRKGVGRNTKETMVDIPHSSAGAHLSPSGYRSMFFPSRLACCGHVARSTSFGTKPSSAYPPHHQPAGAPRGGLVTRPDAHRLRSREHVLHPGALDARKLRADTPSLAGGDQQLGRRLSASGGLRLGSP